MPEAPAPPAARSSSFHPAAPLAIAALSLVLHVLPRPGYGFHRDELLYLAMGDHFTPFGMAFPPLISALARLSGALPFDRLAAIHLLSALAGAALPLLAALTAAAMGGAVRAQRLAAVAALVAPLFLRAGTLFQPVVFELAGWSVATLAFSALLAGRDRRWWLVLGAALGLGALTKFSVAFLGAGLLAGTLASPLLRADLRTRWPWLALGIAALLALPSLAGQAAHGWPFFAQARALRERQLSHVDPVGFLLGQFFLLGAGGPLWVIGLAGLVAARALRPWRPLGVTALAVLLLLVAGRGKDYYYGPMLVPLLAAAAVLLGAWLERGRHRLAEGAMLAWLLVVGALLLPVGIPLLRPPAMARYAERLGLAPATRTNTGGALPLPQDYADMLGWRGQVEAVAAVYRTLPADEQRRAVVLATNYGRAGARAHFGPELGLPYPVSWAGDFFLWGPGDRPGDVTIVVGGSADDWRAFWGDVTEVARARNPWGVEEERDVAIWVCRAPKVTLQEFFRRLGPQWG